MNSRSIAAVVLLGSVLTTASADPPRYRLQPGQHLVYSGEEHMVERQTNLVTRDTDVRVIRANGDGTHTVIVTQVHERFDIRQKPKRSLSRRTDLLIVDVHPDGRIAQRGLDTMGILSHVLPELPADDAEAAAGWRFDAGDLQHHCRRLTNGSDDQGRFLFEMDHVSDRDTLNGFSATSTVEFDTGSGLVRRSNTIFRHEDRQTRRGTGRLTVEQFLPPAELAALAADIDTYHTAERLYETTRDRAVGQASGDEARQLMDAALVHLEAARLRLQSDLFTDRVDAIIQSHKHELGGALERIEYLTNFIDQPSPDWSHVDFEGNPVALKDLRGRVVILDFWYRNCGWCIRAMPTINRVARKFEGRPVTVLGMNIDLDEPRARAVVDHVKLDYRQVRSNKDIARAYGITAFPTVIAVDQDGVVRMIHSGYTPTLEQLLTDVIESLLAGSTN